MPFGAREMSISCVKMPPRGGASVHDRPCRDRSAELRQVGRREAIQGQSLVLPGATGAEAEEEWFVGPQ